MPFFLIVYLTFVGVLLKVAFWLSLRLLENFCARLQGLCKR